MGEGQALPQAPGLPLRGGGAGDVAPGWVPERDLGAHLASDAQGRSANRSLAAAGRVAADWLPAVPLLALGLALLVAPTATILLASLRDASGHWGLGAWTGTLGRSADRRAIGTSLLLAFASACVAALLGTPVAWLLSRQATGRRAGWLSLLNVGANIGGIGLAFGYMAVLGSYGMVTLALRQAGLGLVPPGPASFAGLLLAYTYTNLPLFVLMTLPGMGTIHRDVEEASASLGASRREFWQLVGGPQLAPFLAAGWLLVFTWSVGLYGIAFALAGTAPNSPVRLMTLQIGLALTSSTAHRERAAVMAALLLLIATAALLAYRWTMRRAVRWAV